MELIFTDGSDKRFEDLCRELDDHLNEAVGGEKQRSQYNQYNKLDAIRDVVLLVDNGQAVGCGSFKRYDGRTAEIKRVFVKNEYRGKGLAKAIMGALEERARENGYSKLILETGKVLKAAIGLYAAIGYEIIENYGQYADMPESVCMAKTIAPEETTIRKATEKDIDDLINIRIDFLFEEEGGLSADEETAIRMQLATYFAKHINHDFIAILAEIDGTIVSTAFLAISERPANPVFITGKTGTLLNVFTYPEYRRKGLATQTVCRIIEEAKTLGASSIDLSATEDGKPLYEKLGFKEPKSTAMRLQLC